jgi:F-type H+-transporting ATPase subunit b
VNELAKILLAIALGAPSAAFASEAGHAEHAPSIGTLALPIVNFAIFAFILWRYAWPAVRSALADRQKSVRREIDEAEVAHREARAALESIEALRARSREDGERLVAEIREEAEARAGALLTQARQTADRIRRDAEILGAQEGERAAHAIRREIADRIVARATELVRQRFGESEQRRAVTEFLSEVRS